MKVITKLVVILAIIFCMYMLTYTTEAFGMLECSRIPFDKFIRDIHTPSEYEEWKKNTWSKYTTKDKNDFINWWENSISCEKLNSSYKDAVKSRKQREAIEKS